MVWRPLDHVSRSPVMKVAATKSPCHLLPMDVIWLPFTAPPNEIVGKLSAPVAPKPNCWFQSVPDEAGSLPFQYQLNVSLNTFSKVGVSVCDSLTRNWSPLTTWTREFASGPPSVVPSAQMPPLSSKVRGRLSRIHEPDSLSLDVRV